MSYMYIATRSPIQPRGQRGQAGTAIMAKQRGRLCEVEGIHQTWQGRDLLRVRFADGDVGVVFRDELIRA